MDRLDRFKKVFYLTNRTYETVYIIHFAILVCAETFQRPTFFHVNTNASNANFSSLFFSRFVSRRPSHRVS